MTDSPQTEVLFRDIEYLPSAEQQQPADQDRTDNYRNKLRQFYFNGTQLSGETMRNEERVEPVLLAPLLRGDILNADFPIFSDNDNRSVKAISAVIEEAFSEAFEPGEAQPLAEQLATLARTIRKRVSGSQASADFASQMDKALQDLCDAGLEDRGEAFREQCDVLASQLGKRSGTLFGMSSSMPFQLLNMHLQERQKRNEGFLYLLEKRISGLRDILFLHREESDGEHSSNHFQFARELMSFDQISQIATGGASSGLPESRLHRIGQCLRTLEAAYHSYRENHSMVFVSTDLAGRFAFEDIFRNVEVKVTSGQPLVQLQKQCKKEITEFVQIITALRLAQLEIEQKYDEQLHAPYFDAFNFSYLSDDEILYFRTMIGVESAREVMQHPGAFLSIISDDAPVRILTVNRIEDLGFTDIPAPGHEQPLELAALAMFRRKAYVFQGAIHAPGSLNKALRTGLEMTTPAVWNVLCTSDDPDREHLDHVILQAAVESRYFPFIRYDVRSGKYFGSHVTINENPSPGQLLRAGSLEIKTASGKEISKYFMTIADFLSIAPGGRDKLEVLPTWYEDDALISLSEYLLASRDVVSGKIPFIWVVDRQNVLKRAVIPVTWVMLSRARLDHWQFLQELAGVNSYHVHRALEQARTEWKAEKQKEIRVLEHRLQTEFESAHKARVSTSIERMLWALLDPEMDLGSLLSGLSVESAPAPETGSTDAEPQTEESEPEKVPPYASVSSEAWVESDQCTSCSDCIDALPSVFKYNDDKQAYVHDPGGGPYAKIVALAEKCPARCIHPGLPQNPDEPGLDKLMKRAEKYN